MMSAQAADHLVLFEHSMKSIYVSTNKEIISTHCLHFIMRTYVNYSMYKALLYEII